MPEGSSEPWQCGVSIVVVNKKTSRLVSAVEIVSASAQLCSFLFASSFLRSGMRQQANSSEKKSESEKKVRAIFFKCNGKENEREEERRRGGRGR